LKTVTRKKIVYLRELQINLEDIFVHEYVYDECEELVNSGDLNTEFFDGNRWYFPTNVDWTEVESIATQKIELMNAYIDHPRNFVRRGVIYDDYGEMLVEDALIKTGYIVVAKNAHYFNGKEYYQGEENKPGRKRDLDFIAYERSKDIGIGIQVKNRLEYPRMDDVHLLLDICRTLDLFPLLVTRLSHPRIYAIFEDIKGEVMQTKRYFLQPPFPRDKWKRINSELRIPLSINQWVPDFLLRNFENLKSKL
jgi:hypothetical protein